MPSINNIDKFVQFFNTLGDEPNILEKRGETLEPAKVPENEALEKPEDKDNPFLVNIEEESEETHDIIEDLEALPDDEEELFAGEEFDLEVDAPDLEENENFDIDNLEDVGETLFDDIEELSDIEDLGEDIESIEGFEGMEDEEPEQPFDIDDLEAISSEDDITPDDIENMDEIIPEDDIESLDLEEEEAEELSDEDIEESIEPFDIENLDIEGDLHDDVEELSELSDEDLDTSPQSLDDELNIKDIDFDDIEVAEEEEIPEPEEQDVLDTSELSIEDEVLQDDFGAFEDDESDEFSLGDFGDSFNFDKEASSTASVLEEFTDSEVEEEEEKKEITYTDEEFDAIKKTLFSLPLNLKIVIEEEIAENGLFGVKLEGLMNLLIDEAPLKDIVKYVNKTLGKKIKISSSFAKLTALDLEEKKRSFSYIFLNVVIPKLMWIFPVSIGCSLLFLAGYFWGYKIIKSEGIYKRGHELILIDKYEEAYDMFLEGFNTHRKLKWYYIYADTYLQRKAYGYAEDIYQQIINEDSGELRAVLSYSMMKGFHEAEYAKATNFLLDYIDKGYREYEFMSTLGDIYMEWAKIDPSKYENARLWYSETLKQYQPKPEILFRHLNYLISTDKVDEVLKHRAMYEKEGSLNVVVDGDTYAKMAGYLMDKNILNDIRATLFRGIKDNPRNPNLHYQLARYYSTTDNKREVEKALRNAIFYYSYGGELSQSELASLVDSKRMLGELYKDEERYLASDQNFQESVILYENLLDRNYIEKDKKFGQIYSGYGDIFYYAGNSLSTAYNLYSKAEENGYTTPEISYKKGYINYVSDDLSNALSEFHEAEDFRVTREPLLFAKANTLSYRGSYHSALTYYEMLLRHLNKLEDDHETLYPRENENHLSIIENYIRVYNNIGVTLYKLSGDKDLPEVGAAFTKSTEYYDYLTRDPEFLIRSGIKDLAYYNTRAILYPGKDSELFLYNTISKDFSDLNLGLVKVVGTED